MIRYRIWRVLENFAASFLIWRSRKKKPIRKKESS